MFDFGGLEWDWDCGVGDVDFEFKFVFRPVNFVSRMLYTFGTGEMRLGISLGRRNAMGS